MYKIQIICKTQYQDNLVKYTISWIDNSKTHQYVTSYSSAMNVNDKFLQKLGKFNKRISGVRLFAFDLKYLKKRCNSSSASKKKPLKELSLLRIHR
ncbi:6119_t:CDS:2 [Scutellospora calospora]|uniref:6119_t:CDS:1 n=1 Tax=Scutellospora calospora TaxID=85575 RepID=A0ACA9JV22_9GLOM|nr:6119_t:CDS:2 [Scutellospora calospora]